MATPNLTGAPAQTTGPSNVPVNDLTPTFSTGLSKTSRQVPLLIPAGVMVNNSINPGQAFAAASGNQFYVLATSAPVSIKGIRAANIGTQNQFSTGQGQKVANGFETLEVNNYTLFPVVCLIWVGFDDFINDQLILNTTTIQNIAYPTYSAASSAAFIDIPDLSGTTFFDINGKKWAAVNRVCILVFNDDSGVTFNLQKFGSRVSNGPAIATCFPDTPTRFDISGGYSISTGGGSVNAIVSEIYQAFAA